MLRATITHAALVATATLLCACSTGARTATSASSTSTTTGAGTQGRAVADRGMRPSAGSYTYRGTGSERFDRGSGSLSQYSRSVTATVSFQEGCNWTLSLALARGVAVTHRLCTSDSGVSEAGFDIESVTLGPAATSHWDCPSSEEPYLLKRSASASTGWQWVCAAEDADVIRSTTVLGSERLAVQGAAIATTHIRLDDEFTGARTGTATSEYWVAASGLPVRISSEASLLIATDDGQARYESAYTYTMVAPRPG